MNHILINVAIPRTHVSVRTRTQPPTALLVTPGHSWRFKQSETYKINLFEFSGLINGGKPRRQLRIKNNSLIILTPFVFTVSSIFK